MRFWRLLLSLYPASFRERYGEQTMMLLVRRRREILVQKGRLAAVRFWLRNSLDLLRGAAAENRIAARPSSRPGFRARPTPLDGLGRDLRFAVRRLRKSPGFTAVAVLLMALGIGANSTIFAVLNAVVLRPLPYPDPEQLVQVWESNPEQGWDLFSFSHPNYLDYRDQNQTFTHFAALTGGSYNLTGLGEALRLSAGRVTHDLFPLLGIEPLFGRPFSPEDDAPGEMGRVVLLSNNWWLTHFGGDREVVGGKLVLNGSPYTIIGVMPPRALWFDDWDVFTPLNPQPERHRDDHRLGVIGRLTDGVTAEQGEADLDVIAAALAEQYPESNTGFDTRVIDLHHAIVGQETRTALYMLMGAVVFVLLIAATNLANLLLARSSARQRELAVNVALGSSRSRLLRELLTESTLLALLGGALGLALARLCVGIFRRIDPGRVPRFDELGIDATIVLFAVLLSAVTGIFAGLLPAWQASRSDLNAALQGSGRGAGGSAATRRARGALLMAEVAVSVVLLVGAGLLIRSLWQVQQTDAGLNTEYVLAASLTLPPTQFTAETDSEEAWQGDQEKRAAFYRQLLIELEALPDVGRAAMISGLPFGGGATSMSLRIEGQDYQRGAAPQAYWRIASPGYFETLKIPLLSGRQFTDRDDFRSPLKVIVSHRMAERFWPSENAVGKRFYPWEREEDPVEIVGVVGDVRERDLEQDAANIVYLPHYEFLYWAQMYLVVRTNAEPSSVLSALRSTTARFAPDVPLANAEPLRQIMERTLAPRRFNTLLLLSFAAIAIVLAAVGIYGVMAYNVAQRAPEIGIRVAMGASPGRVRAMVIGQSMSVVAIGATLGIAASLALTGLLESLLYGISPVDPLSLLGAIGFLALVALLASALPARRASRVDTVEALRAQ